MSGESAWHVLLVETLIETIEKRHKPPRGLMVFADHHRFGTDRPATIGGYTPDVFASDLPATFRVIGEAKTPADLESDRSRRQIAAFLDHLALYENSILYLAVPFLSVARARFIIRSLTSASHLQIATEIIPCVKSC
jgi:hypothetical protein